MNALLTNEIKRAWFDLARFDVRSTLPAAIREIMQNGLLDRTFQDALLPEFLFPAMATVRPWQANLGDTVTFTRTGLLTPQSTPITGSDPTVDTYSIEQYSMTMDQYANAIDTNMLISAMTIASKFLEDQQKLGINAGQSLNRIARTKLYGAYAGGRTWATNAATATALPVNDVAGFTTVLVNGKPTAVSASTPLAITVAGVAKNVTGVSATSGAGTLTLSVAATWVANDPVIAANAPVSVRPAAKASAAVLASTDVATFSLFRSAVARLRKMNVPTLPGGAYAAHIDPDTEQELFSDPEFQALARGKFDSPTFKDLSLGIFGGIDWVRNNEARTIANGGSAGTLTVHQPIVAGEGALIAGPFADMGNLLQQLNGDAQAAISMIAAASLDVARIIREPLDRLQQVVGSAWAWVGDFAVPTDSTTGDASLFKRAVLVEHA
jgi:hypothetical protein